MKTKTQIILSIFFLVSCGLYSNTKPQSINISATVLPTVIPTSLVAVPVATEDIPKTHMPSSTITPTIPTPSSTAFTLLETPTPEYTKLPPISTNTAFDVMADLVQTNGGCQIPCLLGLTPGKSDQIAANEFGRYFQNNSKEAFDTIHDVEIVGGRIGDNKGGMYLLLWKNEVGVQIEHTFWISDELVTHIDFSGSVYSRIENGMRILYNDPYFNKLLSQFSLTQLLRTFGSPAEILINVDRDIPGNPSPPAQYQMNVVLFYPHQGFSTEYTFLRKEQDDNYLGCPNQTHGIQVTSWKTKKLVDFRQAVSEFSHINGVGELNVDAFLPIEAATIINIDEFYKMFLEPNSMECLRTPKQLWPLEP